MAVFAVDGDMSIPIMFFSMGKSTLRQITCFFLKMRSDPHILTLFRGATRNAWHRGRLGVEARSKSRPVLASPL